MAFTLSSAKWTSTMTRKNSSPKRTGLGGGYNLPCALVVQYSLRSLCNPYSN